MDDPARCSDVPAHAFLFPLVVSSLHPGEGINFKILSYLMSLIGSIHQNFKKQLWNS